MEESQDDYDALAAYKVRKWREDCCGTFQSIAPFVLFFILIVYFVGSGYGLLVDSGYDRTEDLIVPPFPSNSVCWGLVGGWSSTNSSIMKQEILECLSEHDWNLQCSNQNQCTSSETGLYFSVNEALRSSYNLTKIRGCNEENIAKRIGMICDGFPYYNGGYPLSSIRQIEILKSFDCFEFSDTGACEKWDVYNCKKYTDTGLGEVCAEWAGYAARTSHECLDYSNSTGICLRWYQDGLLEAIEEYKCTRYSENDKYCTEWDANIKSDLEFKLTSCSCTTETLDGLCAGWVCNQDIITQFYPVIWWFLLPLYFTFFCGYFTCYGQCGGCKQKMFKDSPDTIEADAILKAHFDEIPESERRVTRANSTGTDWSGVDEYERPSLLFTEWESTEFLKIICWEITAALVFFGFPVVWLGGLMAVLMIIFVIAFAGCMIKCLFWTGIWGITPGLEDFYDQRKARQRQNSDSTTNNATIIIEKDEKTTTPYMPP